MPDNGIITPVRHENPADSHVVHGGGPRAAILDAIQTETKDVTDRLVDVMLVALRRKLGPWATHVETVRGIGYRLDR